MIFGRIDHPAPTGRGTGPPRPPSLEQHGRANA